jgi:biopolymer transport protein TolR
MKLTPRQKRSERRSRNQTMVDMNLVSLIDVFTILIFFLLSNSGGVETLPSPKAVKLPESFAATAPRDTLVVVVSGTEILVDGRKVSSVQDAMAGPDDMIAPLKAELDLLQANRQVVRAENVAQDTTAGKAVSIMGDKDIPYQLLRRVMATCAKANFSDVSFAVRQRESA